MFGATRTHSKVHRGCGNPHSRHVPDVAVITIHAQGRCSMNQGLPTVLACSCTHLR